jgi:hypothetical protein
MSRLAMMRGIGALAACLLLAALAWLLPPDGGTAAAWMRGLGRLHILALHLPIAFILLVPLLDAAGRWAGRASWCETADLVLGLAFAGAAGAAALGILLAHGDGHAGAAVRWHLWSGWAATLATGAVWALRPVVPRWRVPMGVAVAAVVGWAAHLGGSLTHGPHFLTGAWTAAPAAATSASASVASTATVWQAAILPLMIRSCTECHGEAKRNGGLRLDTPDGWRLGGKSDLPCWTPGKPGDSECLRRVGLTASDDDVMPPDGHPLLKPEEIALLRWWLQAGGDFAWTVAAAQASAPPEVRPFLTAPVLAASPSPIPVPPSPAVDAAWTGRWSEHLALAQRAGLTLAPVSAVPGDGLTLRGFDGGAAVTSAALATLAPLAPFIVEADLAGTAVDDAGLSTIAGWINLRRCDLSRTRVGGAGLAHLKALPQLGGLLLNGTVVDDAAVSALHACAGLRVLSLCQTRVTTAGVAALRRALPACAVGCDVPVP